MSEERPQRVPLPPKSCMITVMFPIQDDQQAYDLKKLLNEFLKDLPDKRFTFQINET